MGIRQFFKNILIFVWYLLTQPFIEIVKMIRITTKKGETASYLSSWRTPLLIATIAFYWVGNTVMTKLSGILLLLTILKTEWDQKNWLARYRQKERQRIEKKLEEEGAFKTDGLTQKSEEAKHEAAKK